MRRRRLESKLDIARDVRDGRRPFVMGLDGAMFPDDENFEEDIREMIDALEQAVDLLGETKHRAPRRRRSISRFMERTWQL